MFSVLEHSFELPLPTLVWNLLRDARDTMNPPLLKLAFVQGPRDGESLEYKPGSTIRIGRIVRGNDIAVKDAGVSTKHLRIVSDSDKWIIYDLGSSNGTILNSEALDPDIPVDLRHGDVIKLGECTSIVVNLETDVQAEVHKLPPRPRRNNRRLAVADPDPVPVEPVQEKPTRKGRSAKQEEQEPGKRSRATTSKALADIEKEPEVENGKEVKRRVGRPRKKVAVTEEEEEVVPVEKTGNSRAQGGKKKAEDLGLNSVKLEVEDTPKGVCLGLSVDTALEEKKRPSRATRSKKKDIGGDSFLDLEMVLKNARKSRTKKKMEQKPSEEEEMEARNEDLRSETSDKEDETPKRVEQVEIGSTCVKEDGETENVQDTLVEERDRKSGEAGVETSDAGCDEEKAEQEKPRNAVKVDLENMTLDEWFDFMEVQLRRQIFEETEALIEPLRNKALRVQQHIAEEKRKQQQAKGKQSAS